MTTEVLLQAIASGLLMGFVYALIAVGLSLIFGLMEIVNFAHGEFLMLAMFTTFWLAVLFGIDPLVSVPICAALLFILGVLVYKGIISRILRAPMLAQIFATFGLAVFLRSGAQFLWSADYRIVPIHALSGRLTVGGIVLGWPQVAASVAALIAFVALYLFVTRTEIGLAIQATSEDREAAALMGISSDRMFMLGWGIGSLCVGIAGALLANFLPIFPDVGALFALLAYVAVALGGFGSIIGVLLAGVIIGLIESIGGFFLPSFKYVLVFALYLGVVLLRPQGLFGRY